MLADVQCNKEVGEDTGHIESDEEDDAVVAEFGGEEAGC